MTLRKRISRQARLLRHEEITSLQTRLRPRGTPYQRHTPMATAHFTPTCHAPQKGGLLHRNNLQRHSALHHRNAPSRPTSLQTRLRPRGTPFQRGLHILPTPHAHGHCPFHTDMPHPAEGRVAALQQLATALCTAPPQHPLPPNVSPNTTPAPGHTLPLSLIHI